MGITNSHSTLLDINFFVSLSLNCRELKLWEINEKICLESTRSPNTIHKKIYVN